MTTARWKSECTPPVEGAEMFLQLSGAFLCIAAVIMYPIGALMLFGGCLCLFGGKLQTETDQLPADTVGTGKKMWYRRAQEHIESLPAYQWEPNDEQDARED